jgi:8-oxo-dGTP pyrophosphatase MutT (NUDIX family)
MTLWRRLLDAGYRRAFQLAYPCAVLVWRYKHHDSVVMAVHVADRVLAVKHSYKPGWVLPGGGVKSGEDHLTAAVRELGEEVGLWVQPSDFTLVWKRPRRRGNGYTHFYKIELDAEPIITVDQREIIAAKFIPANEIL